MREPRLRRLLPLYVVVFNGFVGYSLMITVFTPLLLDAHSQLLPADSSHAVRSVVLGVLLSLYPLGQFVGAPLLGSLSDRWGRRPVLMGTLAVGAVAYVLISVSLAVTNLPLLMVLCFVGGLFEANIAITQSALADVSDTADETDRNRLFGYVYLSVSLAYVAGPLAGGPLADRSLLSWLRPWTPFALVALLLVVTFAAVVLWLPETRTPAVALPMDRPSWRHSLGNMAGITQVFRDTRLRRLYLANFAFSGCIRCIWSMPSRSA
jgi:MFS family permease